MNKINYELINPLVEFSSEQSNIYDENLKKLKEISTQSNQIYMMKI